jgi:hypothetical protein
MRKTTSAVRIVFLSRLKPGALTIEACVRTCAEFPGFLLKKLLLDQMRGKG